MSGANHPLILKPCPFCGSTELRRIVFERRTPEVKCENYLCGAQVPLELWNNRPSEKKLKTAIQKMLNGINFALDEAFSRKTVSSRLVECRKEALKILTGK